MRLGRTLFVALVLGLFAASWPAVAVDLDPTRNRLDIFRYLAQGVGLDATPEFHVLVTRLWAELEQDCGVAMASPELPKLDVAAKACVEPRLGRMTDAIYLGVHVAAVANAHPAVRSVVDAELTDLFAEHMVLREGTQPGDVIFAGMIGDALAWSVTNTIEWRIWPYLALYDMRGPVPRLIRRDYLEDSCFGNQVADANATLLDGRALITIHGHTGMHNDCFLAVETDGSSLTKLVEEEISGQTHSRIVPFSSGPVLVVDRSNPYMPSYATGNRLTRLRFWRLDGSVSREITLETLAGDHPDHDRAVTFAMVGLWRHADAAATHARKESGSPATALLADLIAFHVGEQETAGHDAFASAIMLGDYRAVWDLMQGCPATDLFARGRFDWARNVCQERTEMFGQIRPDPERLREWQALLPNDQLLPFLEIWADAAPWYHKLPASEALEAAVRRNPSDALIRDYAAEVKARRK